MFKTDRFDPRLLAHAASLAASLGFAPVPVRFRRDGWTVERQLVYLAALAAGDRGSEAAARVGMTQQSAGKLLRRAGASAFAGACEGAWRIGATTRKARAAARRALPPGGSFSPPT